MIWFNISFKKKKNYYPRIVLSYNTPRKVGCYMWYQREHRIFLVKDKVTKRDLGDRFCDYGIMC